MVKNGIRTEINYINLDFLFPVFSLLAILDFFFTFFCDINISLINEQTNMWSFSPNNCLEVALLLFHGIL